ncbi:DUF1285 domain-containing protein [Granulosicoccus sp.]|nr:DUF1285 domain-containing protein [Granulosicoccus sp.]MDB4223134.1 DUF1285 domain-containing protein [Granulosicoccus sp.]
MSTSSLDAIAEAISSTSLPPVHLWNPDITRDIDMRIKRNGDWFYLGSKINRIRMVKLFSTVLRVDEGQTYLVTPQERLRIEVEDAQFTAVLVEQHDVGEDQKLVFTTNVDDKVIASEHHSIWVEYKEQGGEPSPYLLVRDSLKALISRTVFYQLAEWSEERDGVLGVTSNGCFMPLSESAL